MKEIKRFFRQYLVEMKDVAKLQWRAFATAVIVLLAVYFGSVFIPPGVVTWLLILPPSLVVAITALARVNDIGPEKMQMHWHVRRLGLIMAGAGAVMLMATPFGETPAYPTWRVVVLVWGMALTWLTTPNMPPWWHYVTGEYRNCAPDSSKLLNSIECIIIRITGKHSVEALKRALKHYRNDDKDHRHDA